MSDVNIDPEAKPPPAGPPPANNCSDCKYWDGNTWDPAQTVTPAEDTRHMCRRFPSEIYKEPTDWCGEYSPGSWP